jgi:hypothetical protein
MSPRPYLSRVLRRAIVSDHPEPVLDDPDRRLAGQADEQHVTQLLAARAPDKRVARVEVEPGSLRELLREDERRTSVDLAGPQPASVVGRGQLERRRDGQLEPERGERELDLGGEDESPMPAAFRG